MSFSSFSLFLTSDIFLEAPLNNQITESDVINIVYYTCCLKTVYKYRDIDASGINYCRCDCFIAVSPPFWRLSLPFRDVRTSPPKLSLLSSCYWTQESLTHFAKQWNNNKPISLKIFRKIAEKGSFFSLFLSFF